MLNYPKDYSEAVVICTDALFSDYMKHHLFVIKCKAAVIAGIGVLAGIVVGLITGNSVYIWGIGIISLLIGLAALLPLLGYRMTVNSAYKGSFLKQYSKTEVLEIATKYVDEQNAFDENMSLKEYRKMHASSDPLHKEPQKKTVVYNAQVSKPIAPKRFFEHLQYALNFSTNRGIRLYLERIATSCSDEEKLKLDRILSAEDTRLRETIVSFIVSKANR